jgi:hypothetical protein
VFDDLGCKRKEVAEGYLMSTEGKDKLLLLLLFFQLSSYPGRRICCLDEKICRRRRRLLLSEERKVQIQMERIELFSVL